jgi:uncharacterized protein (DUF983 family)
MIDYSKPIREISRPQALFLGRCPRCRQGKIYRTLFTMHEHCAVCRLKFQREQGYFLGALYVYYGLSLPIFLSLVFWVSTWRSWSEYFIVFPALLLYAPFIPFTYRTARIIWIHFDRYFDPE